jgi:phospholipid-binding lipoprotein MlaA
LPEPGRDALRHFLDNLNEPIVFANTVLQGRLHDAGTTGCRFLLNSTLGIAGFADVASRHKLPKQIGDLGQTLWAWGIPEGPYLILPLFGPSNPRDGVGTGADAYLDPFRYIARRQDYPDYVTVGRTVVDGVDKRSRNLESVDEIQRESVDYYASLRSLFRQNRAAELRGGPTAPLPAPDLYEDPDH